jgi:hypothetical protein
VLDAELYEVVCCRAVSHFTTETKKLIGIGPNSWLVVIMYIVGLVGLLRIS